MLDLSWEKLFLLMLAALFVLGPDRLPAAAQWLGTVARRIRAYALDARERLAAELGPELAELRGPLEDLRRLRELGPRATITQHLLDGYDPVDDLRRYDVSPDFDLRANPEPAPRPPALPEHRLPGERTPFDPDAT